MVFKNILRIKAALPEVKHVVMFYNNGTVFQTTFEQEINIPKLGANFAEILNHIKNLYNICDYNFDDYKKIIFETDDISIIILKLGEDSNIALFFKQEEEKEIKLTAIKRYMTRIEELIDMDEREIIIQDIIAKEEENEDLKKRIQVKQKEIQDLSIETNRIIEGIIEGDVKKISKEINDLDLECSKITEQMEKNIEEIALLKEKIEQSHKKD